MSPQRPSDNNDDERMIEDILRHALPRPQPSATVRDRAYDSLRDQWRELTARRRRQRRAAIVGVAASILVAFGIGAIWLNAMTSPVSEVDASILRASGTDITINGARIASNSSGKPLVLAAGDRLATGTAARVAVRWRQTGSMRLDENSRLDIAAAGTVHLRRGALYYDSLQFGNEGSPAARIDVETPVGWVSHDGTQFLTTTDGDEVTVSVREGRVRINGPAVDNISVDSGESITIAADGRFSRTDIEPYAAAWQWAADVAPTVRVDGRSVRDMLDWIGRETGLAVRYRSARARKRAEEEILTGIGTRGPRQALRTIPVASLQLRYNVGDARIVVDTPE